MYAETIQTLKSHVDHIEKLKDTLKIEEREKRLKELDSFMAEPGFWDKRNTERAQEVITEKKRITGEIGSVHIGDHGPALPAA